MPLPKKYLETLYKSSAEGLNPLDHWEEYSEKHPFMSMGASFVPGVGVVTGAMDTANHVRRGNYGQAVGSAIGTVLGGAASFIPGMGGVGTAVGKGIGKGIGLLARPFVGKATAGLAATGAMKAVARPVQAAGRWASQAPGLKQLDQGRQLYNKAVAPLQNIGGKTRMIGMIGAPMLGAAYDATNNPQPQPQQPEGEQPMEHMASLGRRGPVVTPALVKLAADYHARAFEKWASTQIFAHHPDWDSLDDDAKHAIFEKLSGTWMDKVAPAIGSAGSKGMEWLKAVPGLVGKGAEKATRGAGYALQRGGAAMRRGAAQSRESIVSSGLMRGGRALTRNAGGVGDFAAAATPYAAAGLGGLGAGYMMGGDKEAADRLNKKAALLAIRE